MVEIFKPIFLSTSRDITYNLTVEEYLFKNLNRLPSPLLYIYTNDNCVVIGKHQNPFREVNLRYLKDNNINLCRRTSGGGAVYQDLGNFCFGFLGHYKNKNEKDTFKQRNSEIITKSLISLGLNSNKIFFNGRNDIIYNQRKISGSAFRIDINNKTYIHHGTMLVNVNLQKMIQVLNPHKLKMISHGITSLKSRVINIQNVLPEITNKKIYFSLMKHFLSHYYPKKKIMNINDAIVYVDNEKKQKNKEIMMQYNYYNSYNWKYGSTPQFTHSLIHKFPFGLVEFVFNVEGGSIKNMYVYSDSNDGLFIDKIKKGIVNIFQNKQSAIYKYNKEDFERLMMHLYEQYVKDIRIKEILKTFITQLI